MRKVLSLTALIIMVSAFSFAGTVTGQIQTPTSGVVSNGTLIFTLSQAAIVSGVASVAPSSVNCYTSTAGNVVGLPDPLVVPSVATNTASGTLVSGTYYVKITYWNASGETIASPEKTIVLSATGSLIVSAPLVQPTNATGYKVYISSTTGTETLQSTVTGWGNFTQSAALSAGASLPVSNGSACILRFSDELIPSSTYYTVTLTNKNASVIPGFSQTWCTYGGANGVINISNGTPNGSCSSTGVYYPTPILATPANNTTQSISGSLDLGSYSLFVASIFATSISTTSISATSLSGITDTTPVPSLTASATVYNHNTGTQSTKAHTVIGFCTLGTDCVETFTGAEIFTISSSYQCTASDASGANAVKVNQIDGSHVTFTGTGTDVVRYSCTGN